MTSSEALARAGEGSMDPNAKTSKKAKSNVSFSLPPIPSSTRASSEFSPTVKEKLEEFYRRLDCWMCGARDEGVAAETAYVMPRQLPNASLMPPAFKEAY